MAYERKNFRLASSSCFLFYTLFHIFIIASAAAIHFETSNETDHQSLLDIKGLIKGDSFQALSSWNDSIHFCDWRGVTCGRLHQRVTVLNMSSFHLVGSLSPSIGNLTFLRELNIQDNNFHGMIPEEVGRLFRLQYLRFANNSFEGVLPLNITGCSELSILDLRGNRLIGGIRDDLSTLSKLYALSLSRNNFSGSIPPSMGNISSLQILSISRNNLGGNIPAEIGWLSNLHVLELSSNKLSGAVPPQLYNISTLQIFSITNNLLSGQFPATVGLTLPNLTLFLADLNQFFGSIPTTLANASGLIKISIGDNSLTGPIPQNLGSLKELQVLHFGHNPLGTDKANDISFISSLTNCTNLQILSLSRIQIGGILPTAIANLSTKLTSLWLNDNIISGSLPSGIGNLASLGYLDVRNNSLSGIIPDSVGKLVKMQELYLSENSFTGEIPSTIGDISELQILVLEQNMLTGNIPVSLSNCSNLQEFTVSQNRLSGALPKELLGLSSLSLGLLLAQNQFTGSLPSEVGNMKNLVSLDISENKLSGEIPTSIDGCEMLENLRLKGNFLEGSVPSTLGELKSIQVIDLSQNNLSGQIPASLAKLNFITTLNLSYNMLEGEVPMDGIFANYSAFSALGNGKLCGGIKALNLSSCPKPTKKKAKLATRIVIAIAITIPLAIVLLLISTYAIHRLRSSKQQLPFTSAVEKQNQKLSYAELYDSTNGFSSENLIGEGKYGSVYKGVLKPDEQMVAVKVLKLHQHGAHKSFLAECAALRNIRHRNLVKIITSCSSLDFKHNDFKALIFKYVPNGSLENWLHPSSAEEEGQSLMKLQLIQRLNIAIDIASALDYLHNHCGTPIIHCDLKPSNILLGDDFHALVSDFGLAKFLSSIEGKSHQHQSSSVAIRGTVGYVAPEYGMGGEVSTQGDVYSYGILLLELFTGKRPTDSMFTEDFSLHSYVKMALPHQVMEIVDPKISKEAESIPGIIPKTSKGGSISQEECYLSMFRIGVSCSAEIQRDRMNIKDVLSGLQAIRNEFVQVINESQMR
ncbi:probable LRR receptor-like serine/threonine-protein kinase At3g47570 [Coffea eugenioides]|uniref:probable LRR receptor-like serine/threonine-protein kinase At3g47570 n=1 Tax=Coffea eugenioides TaxID=49369 RepID=UPI000F6156F2|nr:probable LRR receptor-like serine/threonine-protein kinase At3g47570 [Coffea eugenioides]